MTPLPGNEKKPQASGAKSAAHGSQGRGNLTVFLPPKRLARSYIEAGEAGSHPTSDDTHQGRRISGNFGGSDLGAVRGGPYENCFTLSANSGMGI